MDPYSFDSWPMPEKQNPPHLFGAHSDLCLYCGCGYGWFHKNVGKPCPKRGGQKMLVLTTDSAYDARGRYIGRIVVEVAEAYTEAQAKERRDKLGCPECGAINEHHNVFVHTNKNQEEAGYYRKCSRA